MSGTTRERLKPVDDAAERPVYYDEGNGTYHIWCTVTDYEPVSTAVLVGVSSILGVEPENLERLSGSVDPDALNAIAVNWYGDESRTESTITFPFARCTVTVRDNGEVVIEPDRGVDAPMDA